jgi:hypothetical protein
MKGRKIHRTTPENTHNAITTPHTQNINGSKNELIRIHPQIHSVSIRHRLEFKPNNEPLEGGGCYMHTHTPMESHPKTIQVYPPQEKEWVITYIAIERHV